MQTAVQAIDWVTGADGKVAGQLNPEFVCWLLGYPCRVAKLRALGNAIDLRPATAFIQAVHESLNR